MRDFMNTHEAIAGDASAQRRHWLQTELLPVLSLFVLFLWLYGRLAPQLYFVMDDYIETPVNLAKPLPAILADIFAGRLDWSGYRPITYACRALLSHWFRLDFVMGYYLFGLGLHWLNTWLVLRISKQLLAHTAWACLAALIFLLLPSHNEAIFYMSANANLIGLCFALTTLAVVLAVTQPHLHTRQRWRYHAVACLTYALAVLAYEVLLPLPILLWLLDWRRLGKEGQRQQRPLYWGLIGVAVLLLGLRFWVMDQRLTHQRADYAISTDWFHIARGYVILWGQMILLHTSAWENYPLFQNLRAWLSPLDRRVLISLGLVLANGLGWSIWVQRSRATKAQTALYWFEWSVVWLYLFSLPFAALGGRNPENRYVYIPSVGFALGLTALFILGYERVAHRALLRKLTLGLTVLLVGFYAYVTTSDGAEWREASRHTRAVMTQAPQRLPQLPVGSNLFQSGVPEHVGAAYVFSTAIAFQHAMQWLYADHTLDVTVGHLALRDYLRSDAVDLAKTYLLAYDSTTYTTHAPTWVEDCYSEIDCVLYPLAPFVPPTATVTVDFAEGLQLLGQQLTWLYRINHATTEPVLVTCWRLTKAPNADYTLYIHFTDASGDTTLGQADHKLRQAYPFAPTQVTTTGWPLNTPICDLTNLTEAFAATKNAGPASVRGGIWLPETGVYLAPTAVQGYTLDQYGRIIFETAPVLRP